MNPIEQSPKNMPNKQMSLDFGNHDKQGASATPPTPEAIPIESLSDLELHALYKQRVGVDANLRGLDRPSIIAGLADPKAEKDRLHREDQEEDQELRRLGRQHI